MHSILFQIGPVTVYGYGFMIAVGVISAFVIAGRLAKRLGLDGDVLFNMGVAGVAGGIIGAKLLYYIVEFDAIVKDPSMLLDFGSGFVVYGGLIAGILFPMLYAKMKKINFWPYLDCAVPGIAFAQGCGRIGCFLAGCCYGKQTGARFGVVFPENCLAPAGVSLIPTQLISAAGDFIFAFVLLAVLKRLYKPGRINPGYMPGKFAAKDEAKKYAAEKHTVEKRAADAYASEKYAAGESAEENGAKGSGHTAGGLTSGLYIMLYAAGRFAVEFLRDDPRGAVGVLSTSQFIAIFMFAAGAALFAYRVTIHRQCRLAV